MAKKMIRPIRTETEYDGALEEIEPCFENEPKPGIFATLGRTSRREKADLCAVSCR
jgi:antitoxin component HigA of HigAB toxin-antitoxin module